MLHDYLLSLQQLSVLPGLWYVRSTGMLFATRDDSGSDALETKSDLKGDFLLFEYV